MKRLRWLILVFCAGCNAIVGNDIPYVQKNQDNSSGTSSQSVSALVSAGEVAKSSHYKMVFSVGQPSVAQGSAHATQYSMDNGLICK